VEREKDLGKKKKNGDFLLSGEGVVGTTPGEKPAPLKIRNKADEKGEFCSATSHRGKGEKKTSH